MNFTGSIIEESLENKDVINHVRITSTEVEDVTERMMTPWLKHWTVHDIEVPVEDAEKVAVEISKALDSSKSNWYADFENDTHHYIIFKNKVFYIDRKKVQEYRAAREYGISIGVPEHQVDFEKKLIS
jgi:hypothetical protein